MSESKQHNGSGPKFAQGWCFTKVFMMFLIGCVIGVYYEEILNFLRFGEWASRSGQIYGPFNPIYGAGFAAFAFFLGKNNATRPWWKTFLYAAILGGCTEFALSWVEEVLFHAKSWDYSNMPLNIAGRTTVPIMLIWGLGGLLFMRFVYPFLSDRIESIPYKFGKAVFPIVAFLMIMNMVVSYSALFRQAQRKQGNPPLTIIGQVYDQIYTDDFLARMYANMEDKNAPADPNPFGGGNGQ